jgi:hypothetical protein
MGPLIRWIVRPYARALAKQFSLAQQELRRRGEQRMLKHREAKGPLLREHRQRRMDEHRRRKREAAEAAGNGNVVDRVT